MTEPIRMPGTEIQSEDPSNREVLETLLEIKRNTGVTKGWVSFFGITFVVALLVYLFITFIGVATVINLFSGILG